MRVTPEVLYKPYDIFNKFLIYTSILKQHGNLDIQKSTYSQID